LFGERFGRRALAAAAARGLKRDDVLATLAEFTARSVALNYRRHLGGRPERVILCGGGAANPELVRRLTAALGDGRPAVEVLTSNALGWPAKAIEPAAFAWLAGLRLQGRPGNLPATTGARRAVLLGQLTMP
jgi:anhydro-N-acetylmuramic acid kinase